jgi:uncharacterized protein YbaR (Trm112 family)
MEGREVVDFCPDCLDNDELVVMEKHECPVPRYVKLVCPVCGGWLLSGEEKGKDE